MWKIVRNDRDIIVLPSRYLNELGNLTDDHSSSSAGQINNMAGKFSTADVILNGDVHFRMIQEVLTPNLTATIPMIKDELDYAMAHDIPKACDSMLTLGRSSAVHNNMGHRILTVFLI